MASLRGVSPPPLVPQMESLQEKTRRLQLAFFEKIGEHNDAQQRSDEERIEGELEAIYRECPSVLTYTSPFELDRSGECTPFYEAYMFNNHNLIRFLHRLDSNIINDRRNKVTAFLDGCIEEPNDPEELEDKLAMIQTLYNLDPAVLEQVDVEGRDCFFLAGFTRAPQVLALLFTLNPEKAKISLRKKVGSGTLLQNLALLFATTQVGEKKEQLGSVIRVLLNFDPTLYEQLRELSN